VWKKKMKNLLARREEAVERIKMRKSHQRCRKEEKDDELMQKEE